MVFIILSALLIIPSYIRWDKIQEAHIEKNNRYEYTVKIVDNGTKIHLVGELRIGVSKDIQNILKSNSKIICIIIDSYGGWESEGYKIAELIEKYELNTYVSSVCASAATSAFVAGKERYIATEAILGFHNPYNILVNREDFQLTPQELLLIRKKIRKAKIVKQDHLSKHGVTKSFIEKLKNYNSLELFYPSTEELAKSGIIHGTQNMTSISDLGIKYRKYREAEEYNLKSIRAQKKSNYEEAIQLATKAIELKNNCARLYYNRAFLYKDVEQYEPMANDLTKAIELYKNSDDFLIKRYGKMLDNRHYAYFYLEKYDKALNDINSLIKIDSLNEEYYKKRGQTYTYLDSLLLAVNDFTKAIQLNPNINYVYGYRGYAYYELKEYDNALDNLIIETAIKTDEESNFPLLLQGASYIEIKDYKNAIETLVEYLKIEDTYHDEAYLLLAIAYYKSGDNSEADKYFCKAESLKVDKDSSWEYYDLPIYHSIEIKKTLKELGKL